MFTCAKITLGISTPSTNMIVTGNCTNKHVLSIIFRGVRLQQENAARNNYSGQVDRFRNPMKNELKTRPCLKPVFETISNTDANFLNLHIDKATKTSGDKHLYLITHFTKQTLHLNYLLLTLNVTEQFLKNPKRKRPFFF